MLKKNKSSATQKGKAAFLFFIGDEGVVVTHLIGNHIEKKLFVHSATDDMFVSVRDMLMKDPEAPISILLDNLDQSYQTQSFPPVAKVSVKKLVEKRIERDFAPGDITSYLPLGKEKTGRQDWKFLLISVVPSPQLMQWLDFILELYNPFEGIFLVPVEAENLIKALGKEKKSESKSQWKMLVMHNKVSGFRQVITRNGRLTFTRLTQSSGSENMPLVIAGNIEQEMVTTIEYLKRIAYKEEDGLDVTVVAAQDIVSAIDTTKISGYRHIDLMSPADLAEKLSIPSEEYKDNHFGDILFSSFFHTTRKKVLPLQTKMSAKLARLYQMMRAVKVGALLLSVLLIGGILYHAYLWYDAFESQQPLERSIQQNQSELNTIQAQTELLPEDIQKIQDTVSIHEAFADQKHVPLAFIQSLSEVHVDGIMISNISWQSENDFKDRADKKEDRVSVELEVDFVQLFNTSEKRLAFINSYFEALERKFSSYDIEYADIPGTLKEGGELIVDYTNPESKRLTTQLIKVVVTLTLKKKEEGQS